MTDRIILRMLIKRDFSMKKKQACTLNEILVVLKENEKHLAVINRK